MLATNVGLDLDVDLTIIESTDLVIESTEENLREQGTLQSASACRLDQGHIGITTKDAIDHSVMVS